MVASLDQPAALILHGSSSIALILQPVTNLQPVTHTLTTRFQPVAPAPALLHCPHPRIACPLESLAGLYWSPAGIARTDPARRLVSVTHWTLARSHRPTPFLLALACTLALLHSLALSHLLAGSQAHTPSQARRLARLYARTLARSYACTLARSLACLHLPACMLALARSHLPGSHSLAGWQARALVRSHACTLVHSHARSHACLLARSLSCLHLLARTLALARLQPCPSSLGRLDPLAQRLAPPCTNACQALVSY
ncbi:hypothetical protein PCASD_22369 [Puccinia coronata f. sp. avenae]|uniref:Uncharacterized protein n=1 Tax=Puccinia coronata f. sp. avenae TaxID=200324 RepID=A0A2N5SR77_9BASI|nr:hypothetical protein PCASD_22369 [Puccinia coronata f. sp. avenae]